VKAVPRSMRRALLSKRQQDEPGRCLDDSNLWTPSRRGLAPAPAPRAESPSLGDLGSGAGFPGLVLACALADETGAQVHLIESTRRRRLPARLRHDNRSAGIVHNVRIEEFTRGNRVAFDAVTGVRSAPMDKLLAYAIPLLKTGTVALFPKGQDVGVELTLASKSWSIEAELVPSTTDPHGRIVFVRRAERR